MRERRALACCLGVVLVVVSASSQAADDSARLRQLQRQLDQSRDKESMIALDREALARDLQTLGRDAHASAETLLQQEMRLTSLEARRTETARELQRRQDALDERNTLIGDLVSALGRVARVPREALLLREASAIDAARAARLLATVTPAIEAEARALRDELATLAALRLRLDEERSLAATQREILESDHAKLRALIERRAALAARLDADRQSLATQNDRLAREVTTLREALERVAREQERRAAAAARQPYAEARGRIRLPVEGRVVGWFGQLDDAGQPRRGLDIAARAGATVVAPWHGAVAFAGPFRGYGVILILEHSDGYHCLIAGLARIDVKSGQTVIAGEAIAVAGPGEKETSTVYVEWRRNGQPVDPRPWLAPLDGPTHQTGKVNG
jgi:septal ring factor EnvC (AmiA/AmiB activator)